MKIGKLTNEQLKNSVLNILGKAKREETVVSAGIGIDSAILNFGGDLIYLSTDPITAVTPDAGRLAVYVSTNDIAAAGATPVAILMTVMCPPGTAIEEIEALMKSAKKAADNINVDIVGGHTEITDAVNRIVVSVAAVGRKKAMGAARADIGDAVLLTGYAGCEGSFILKDSVDLSEEDKRELKLIEAALDISAAASIAAAMGANTMHDVTEGGILGAAYELAEASGVGITIFLDKIPVLGVTKKICDKFKLDVFRLIASGCLLIGIGQDKKAGLTEKLKAAGVAVCEVGVVTKEGYLKRLGETDYKMEPPSQDQLFDVDNKKK